MNEQVKEKWLSSLRSGDYQQTQLTLHTEDGFCCLGVLCDLYGKEYNEEWNLVEDEDCNYYEFQDKKAILPVSVVEWAGVEDCNPVISFRSLVVEWAGVEDCNPVISFRSLVELNDTGSTFNEIADLIEKHL